MASRKKKAPRLEGKSEVTFGRFLSDNIHQRGRVSKNEILPAVDIEVLCKISDCLESLTEGMVGMKQVITENGSKISQLLNFTELEIGNDSQASVNTSYIQENNKIDCESIHSSQLQNNVQKVYTCSQKEEDAMSRNKKFRNTISLLDKKSKVNQGNFDKQVLRVNALMAAMPLMPTNNATENDSGRQKFCRRSGERDEALLEVLAQLEEENSKSKKLEEMNSELRAQIRTLISKTNKKNSQDSEEMMEELQRVSHVCDRLRKENLSLKDLVEEEKQKVAKYSAAKRDLEFNNENLCKSLNVSQTELKEAQEYIKRLKENESITLSVKEQENRGSYEYLTSKIKLLEEDRERSQARIQAKEEEAESLRSEIRRKRFLESQVEELEDKYRELQQKADDSTKRYSLQESKVQSLEKDSIKLRHERNELAVKVQAANREKTNVDERYKDAKNELNKTVTMNNHLTSALQEAVKSKSNLEQINVNLKESIREVQTENRGLHESFSEVEEVKKSLASQNSSLKTQILELKSQHSCIQDTLFRMQKEKQKCKAEYAMLMQKMEKSRDKVRIREADYDRKMDVAKKYTKKMEILNENLKSEVIKCNERLVSHDQLRRDSSRQFEELEKCKKDLAGMKKTEKENNKRFSATSSQCQRLNEQISHLEKTKLELEAKLDKYKSKEASDACNKVPENGDGGNVPKQLKDLLTKLQKLLGRETNIKDDMDVNNVVAAVHHILESKGSQVKELQGNVQKLKEDINRLSCCARTVRSKEEEEQSNGQRDDQNVANLEHDFDQQQRITASPSGGCDDSAFQEQAPGRKGIELQVKERNDPEDYTKKSVKYNVTEKPEEIGEKKTGEDLSPDDMKVEDLEDFDFDEPSRVPDVNQSTQSTQKTNAGEQVGDLSSNDSSKDMNEFKGYVPSVVCIKTKELPPPSPSFLAPLITSGSSLHFGGDRKSSLGPLPPLTKSVKVSKAGRKKQKTKTKKKNPQGKGNMESDKGLDLKDRKISKAFDFDDNDVEFTNDEIADLLDNF